MSRLVVLLALVAGLAGCGNANVVTPVDVAQNYVYAVAEGNFPGACALLEPATEARLVSVTRSSCPRLFARCLPNESTRLNHDQAQLLYANADLRVSGHRADVTLSGTTVAKAAKEVALAQKHGRWRLTSPGRAITRCVARLRRHRAASHRGKPAGG